MDHNSEMQNDLEKLQILSCFILNQIILFSIHNYKSPYSRKALKKIITIIDDRWLEDQIISRVLNLYEISTCRMMVIGPSAI
jgi:hypothetical protein